MYLQESCYENAHWKLLQCRLFKCDNDGKTVAFKTLFSSALFHLSPYFLSSFPFSVFYFGLIYLSSFSFFIVFIGRRYWSPSIDTLIRWHQLCILSVLSLFFTKRKKCHTDRSVTHVIRYKKYKNVNNMTDRVIDRPTHSWLSKG